jgi:hypothetical protein
MMRCARCGRRVGIYLSEMGPYLAHRIPLALHRAVLHDLPSLTTPLFPEGNRD